MAMEINPLRSKDPEQPRDTIPSQLISTLTEEAEALIQPEKAIFQHPIDVERFHDFTQEAYGNSINATSAYLEIVPFTASVIVSLEDGSYLDYRLDDSVAEATTRAVLTHFAEHSDGESLEKIDEKEMDASDLIVFVRSLDSVVSKDETLNL